jgi:hypothetical protein
VVPALRELVITGAGGGAGGLIVRSNMAVPVPPPLVAPNVTLKGPLETVGVPEIRPVAVLTDRPDGKPLALKLVGLFVAVIW